MLLYQYSVTIPSVWGVGSDNTLASIPPRCQCHHHVQMILRKMILRWVYTCQKLASKINMYDGTRITSTASSNRKTHSANKHVRFHMNQLSLDTLLCSGGFPQSDIKSLDSVLRQFSLPTSQELLKIV